MAVPLFAQTGIDLLPRSREQMQIVLDAGHGGYDFGITSNPPAAEREKDISLSLTKDLSAVFSKKGKKVFLTRKVDQYMPLIDRINLVNQKKPTVFISIHCSMSENFVLYSPEFEEEDSDEIVDLYSLSSRQKKHILKSKALSESIGKAIKDEFKVNIIYREMPLPLLNSADAASVLIELPSPKSMVYDQQMRTRLVNTIINGIEAYEY
jgi:N-acetylmuramoyl-L-alanine amidase